MTTRGIPPTPAVVRRLVEDQLGHSVGVNFVATWVRRHSDQIMTGYLTPIEHKRKKATSYHHFNIFFENLKKKIDSYNINPCNIYNMDEKGFLIGYLQKTRRIFAKKQFESGILQGQSHDGNREWITILACVCADGTALPPAIIYPGQNIQDTWLQDWENERCFFTSSPNGWTSDEIAREWVEHCFQKETKEKARQGRDWRLLIMDGHGSHVTMKFIDFCESNRILVIILPAHSTSQLQPLDVKVFRPLAAAYSLALDGWMHNCEGLSSINKRHFFKLFWHAWEKAMTEKNILSGFSATGISPYDPAQIMSIFPTWKPPEEAPQHQTIEDRPSTNESSFSALSASDGAKIRSFLDRSLGRDGTDIIKIRNTLLKFASEISILRHRVEGLEQGIREEKKKAARSKPLFEQLRAQSGGGSVIFSPSKISLARQLQDAKDAEKIEEDLAKQARALEKEQKKERKDLEEKRKVEIREQQKIAREEAKAEKLRLQEEAKASRQAAAQLRKEVQLAKKSSQKPRKSKKPIQEDFPVVPPVSRSGKAVLTSGRPQRARRLPRALDDYEIELV